MNSAIADSIVGALNAMRGVGENCEGFKEFTGADQLPRPTDKLAAGLVVWERDAAPTGYLGAANLRFIHQASFTVYAFVTDLRKGDSAARSLEDLILRRDAGQWKGLKPALMQLRALQVDGLGYFLKVGQTRRYDSKNIPLRFPSMNAQGFFSLAAAIEIEATLAVAS